MRTPEPAPPLFPWLQRGSKPVRTSQDGRACHLLLSRSRYRPRSRSTAGSQGESIPQSSSARPTRFRGREWGPPSPRPVPRAPTAPVDPRTTEQPPGEDRRGIDVGRLSRRSNPYTRRRSSNRLIAASSSAPIPCAPLQSALHHLSWEGRSEGRRPWPTDAGSLEGAAASATRGDEGAATTAPGVVRAVLRAGALPRVPGDPGGELGARQASALGPVRDRAPGPDGVGLRRST